MIVDEEMIYDWHAFDFLHLLHGNSSREYHFTSYSCQRVDVQSLDLEVEDGGMYQHDIHDDA